MVGAEDAGEGLELGFEAAVGHRVLRVAVGDGALVFEDGAFRVAGTDRAVGLIELAEAARRAGKVELLTTTREFTVPGRSYPNGAHFAEVPVGSISPNPRQPRQVFDEEAMAELVHSIKEIGLLQPVVVRPVGEQDGEKRYELIMGERRWRATQEAGLDVIPAIVRETSDDDLLRDALLENLHRSQLNPLEEAAAYQQLLDDFGCTHEELAGRIGRSRPQISNTLRRVWGEYREAVTI